MTRDFIELADDLGSYFEDAKPVERPKQIESRVYRPRRPDLWPPEVWAEMQDILNGSK